LVRDAMQQLVVVVVVVVTLFNFTLLLSIV
jgi:hypothetical protein